jgi:hypothetical protein
MLASITPLGERSRNQRWGVTVFAHAVGGLLGGAAVGALLATVGLALSLSDTWRLLVFAVLLATGAAADLRVGGLRPPTHRRQVDELWLHRYRGWVYGAGFGLQLGAGFLTIVSSAVVYAMFAGALLSRSPVLGAVVGATFGLARGLTPMTTRRVDSSARLAGFHRGLIGRAGTAAAVTVAAQLALAVAALGVVLT